jgi:hypothetical protein
MTRIRKFRASVYVTMACLLLFGSSTCLMAQNLAAETFLDRVSAHPTGDQIERDQSLNASGALNIAVPSEVRRVLPSILRYTSRGNNARVREYAAGFLLSIAIRPDGADLLSTSSNEISSLILDADPIIQNVAVHITYFVIFTKTISKQPYLSALVEGLKKPETPQDVAVSMAGPLLSLDGDDPKAIQAVHNFLHRDNLTVATRIAIMHGLPQVSGGSEVISRDLTMELDDAHPWVRAAALVAFANLTATDEFRHSTSAFRRLSKDRIERMAKDPQENPQIRELAKQALAGQTSLNPNIDVPLEAIGKGSK